MMNITANHFENMAKKLGLSIKIPRPGRAVRYVCSITNGVLGTALIAFGIVLKKSPLILLGALAIVGVVILSFNKQQGGSS